MVPNTYLFNKMFEIHMQHSRNQIDVFLSIYSIRKLYLSEFSKINLRLVEGYSKRK